MLFLHYDLLLALSLVFGYQVEPYIVLDFAISVCCTESFCHSCLPSTFSSEETDTVVGLLKNQVCLVSATCLANWHQHCSIIEHVQLLYHALSSV